jgi:UDP-2-acetamido-3-amino-2,3-dideoxy-glucuronate N-acetyltransferase
MSNLAVLGCGYWGQNLVRNFFQLGVLKVICDPAEQGRERAAQLAPGVELQKAFNEVFARKDIDAIVLATPAETHHLLALRAMEAGKDVLVEKPLALTLKEGLEMQQAAARHKRILMVGHLLEYHPAILKLRELLASGSLGKVCYVYSNRLNFGKVRLEENALWSFAPHDIAVILRLFGESPIEVTCVGGNYLTPNLADCTVSCLHFRGGQRAHIFVSWLNPFKEQKLVVVGDKKMAVFNDVSKEDKLVLFNQWVELNGKQPILQREGAEAMPISPEEPLRRECEHFLECIRERKTPLSDAESGIQVLKVLQACQISMQLNGRPIALNDVN